MNKDLPKTMHAVVLTGHGGFDKMEYRNDVPVPLPKNNDPFWKHDTFWTTGLSSKATPLRVNTPGQNRLGNILQNVHNPMEM